MGHSKKYLRIMIFFILAWLVTCALCFAGAADTEFKITPNDASAGDHFGRSVSATNDYVVIGAENADGEYCVDCGSAYIFKRSNNNWIENAKLSANDGATYDKFGASVSAINKYVIVGASHAASDDVPDSGAAYIFSCMGNKWSQTAKLTADDGETDDFFGNSVAIGDNYVVIGAEEDDDNGDKSGSVYIFERNGSAWHQAAKLKPDDGKANDLFGSAVAASNNYVIVGAFGGWAGSGNGSAYIFECKNGNWHQKAKLTASDGESGDCFGFSVSIKNDYAIVGAIADDFTSGESGSVYIFKRSAANQGTWTQVTKLIRNEEQINNFGGSVFLTEKYAVVGAPETDSVENPGKVFIFKRNNGYPEATWNQVYTLSDSEEDIYKLFGAPVSAAKNYVVVGAVEDDVNGMVSGSAFIYELEPSIFSNE